VLQKTLAVITFAFLCSLVTAQVAPPKRESRWHHEFSRHRENDNLPQRFAQLRCAFVLIRTTTDFGTGFFVSSDGDIATAAHVLGQRTFLDAGAGKMTASLTLPTSFIIVDSDGKSTEIPANSVEKNGDAWGADVALVKSGIHTNCWLALAPDDKGTPGEHLVTLGFPGLAWGSLSMYTGIMSAIIKPEFVVGITNKGEGVKPQNDFIRVQMPVSPGLSGAAIINDENRVIGILTNAGASTRDIDLLIQLNHLNAFAVAPPVVAPPTAGQQQVTWNLNVFSIVAQLAESLRNFASPGYGDAVPIHFLKKESQGNPQHGSRGH
jgi:S1-C subfamily serine protease